MKHLLTFNGLNFAGDDQSAQPGQLSLCAGVELHDGALRPSVLPTTRLGGGGHLGGRLLYVHQTSSYTHFIAVMTNGQLFHAYENSDTLESVQFSQSTGSFDGRKVMAVQSVGNTLILLATDGIHYAVYKSGIYNYLGQRPPFPELQFSLNSYTSAVSVTEKHSIETLGDMFEVGEDDVVQASNFKEEQQATVTEQTLAAINKTLDAISSEGAFYAPFLLRYCYRLYDGSCIWHSAPILLFTTLRHPVTTVVHDIDPESLNKFYFYVFTQHAKLKWRCLNTQAMADISDWVDIVKSVDFFITPQFSRIDTARKVEHINNTSEYSYDNPGFLDDHYYVGTTARMDNAYQNIPLYMRNPPAKWSVEIPEQDEDAYMTRIRDAAAFYRLATVEATPGKFSSNFAELDFSPDTLRNIATQEQLTDDYRSHDSIVPAAYAGTYVYNRRLHIYGISTNINMPQPFDLLFPYCQSAAGGGVHTVTAARLLVSTDDGDRVIALNVRGQSVPKHFLHYNAYLFFPNARAKRVYLQLIDDSTLLRDAALSPSALLEGALAFTPIQWSNDMALPDVNDADVPAPNRLFVSEVDNPFFFPAEGRVAVGLGVIRAVAATTRALSQGQFGQFPLMAFCSDGIWALNVSSAGTYSSVHPVSREVCTNPDSVCQLDQSVLFATDRGISRVVESSIVPCSDMLDGPMFKCAEALPKLRSLFATPVPADNDEVPADNDEVPADNDEVPHSPYENEDICELLDFSTHPFSYFRSGRVLYDFANSRVLVLPPASETGDKLPVYVFSLRDQAWSTMLLPRITVAFNAYPYPYIQLADDTLEVLNERYDYADASVHRGIMVTRPLSYASVMQALQAYSQLNNCKESQLFVLYGSNYLQSWHYIGRSQRSHLPYLPAHAFRYFRIALYLQMRTYEQYSSISLDVIEKYQKL